MSRSASPHPDDLDVAEPLGLVELDASLLEQLEHGEEAHDHLEPLDEAAGQPAERDPPDAGQLVDQLGDGVGDADPHRGDVEQVDARHGPRRQRRRIAALWSRCGVTPSSRSGTSSANRSSGPTARRKRRSASSASRLNTRGDVLERLALEQPGEQQVALLPQGELVVEVDVVAPGQQAPGLQLDQRRRDQQELGGDVEVERLQPLDLDEVGVDDPGQGDLVDVDLLLRIRCSSRSNGPS